MLSRYWTHLASTLIQVPHHGSRTSSTMTLLQRVKGSAALASTSRYNAWRLPSKNVVERYLQSGYRWLDTPHQGQISVLFSATGWQVRTFTQGIFYLVGIISGLARGGITGRICGYFNRCWFSECIR